jgi:hypothetical protein
MLQQDSSKFRASCEVLNLAKFLEDHHCDTTKTCADKQVES